MFSDGSDGLSVDKTFQIIRRNKINVISRSKFWISWFFNDDF